MKLKYSIAPLLFAALLSGTGCQEEAEVYPAVYMTDAQSNPDKSMTVEEAPAKTSFTVSSSELARQDVHVTIEVQPQLIDAFNRKTAMRSARRKPSSKPASARRLPWNSR